MQWFVYLDLLSLTLSRPMDCSIKFDTVKSNGPLYILRGHIQELFHVYFNIFEFHFLRLHINKTNKFCFYMQNGHVPGIAK